MNLILVLLLIVFAIFASFFIAGMIKAAILGSDKKRRARALVSLSRMTEEQITALKDIFIAYKANDIEKANRVSEEVSPEIISFLVDFFDYNNRPVEYSSGKAGKLLWITFEDKYKKLGYSGVVSKIILGVVMDNYNEVLEKMADKQEKAPERSVIILGETIDLDSMPKLYHKAQVDPEWLAKQLKSIAKAWHGGNIRSAMIAFESDLEHG